jgi:hypothetical protein
MFILYAHVVKAHKAHEFCWNFYNKKKRNTTQEKLVSNKPWFPEIEILPTKKFKNSNNN